MPPKQPSPSPGPRGWEARLELELELREGRSVVARRRHHGPLVLQRPFYPEADGTCHAYLLHPPGGLVGGDHLALQVRVGDGARLLLTTPAATKLYRSATLTAHQDHQLRVGHGARLEWLPQESIAYEGTRASITTRIELRVGAELIACDVLCLGRPAAGEGFERGSVEQRLQIYREGEPLLLERACYLGGDPGARSPVGLRGQPVVGTLVCVAERRDAAVVEALRAVLAAEAPGEAACSELPHALVCRYLGPSAERAQRALRAAWAVLRARCFGTSAIPPRIWAT